MTARALVVAISLIAGCRTVEQDLGVPGGRVLSAPITTSDGGYLTLWRWTPTDAASPRVLVVPELGFDHRLVTPLAEHLRDAGFDVATLDGRYLAGDSSGLAAWTRDVARALSAFGPARVLAIGVGGRAAFEVAEASPDLVRGLVAVNVPLVRADPNAALAGALADKGFDPAAWLTGPDAAILLASGRRTPRAVVDRLTAVSMPVPRRLSDELTLWLATDLPPAVGTRPVFTFACVKDNVVQAEQALFTSGDALAVQRARRIGRIELFSRDYGHLDWLVDDAGLADVLPVLARALEAIP